jgi:hypothetical protein
MAEVQNRNDAAQAQEIDALSARSFQTAEQRLSRMLVVSASIGACTACAERFTVPVVALSRAMAQANL